MSLDGEYEPSPAQWVRDQVEAYESSGGQRANTLRDTGLPVIIVTSRGNKSGKIRKTPLMRVEHDGEYLLVASKGGAPSIPSGTTTSGPIRRPCCSRTAPSRLTVTVRELSGPERAAWWERAVKAFPPYADYQAKTERTIPVFLASRRG